MSAIPGRTPDGFTGLGGPDFFPETTLSLAITAVFAVFTLTTVMTSTTIAMMTTRRSIAPHRQTTSVALMGAARWSDLEGRGNESAEDVKRIENSGRAKGDGKWHHPGTSRES